MVSSWSLNNPTRVLFSNGSIDAVGGVVAADRAVLVTTPGFVRRGTVDRIQNSMEAKLLRVLDIVTPNADLDDIDAAHRNEALEDADCVIALGGGSCIDTAKALVRVLNSSSDSPLSDHFRHRSPLPKRAVPQLVAIPTTSGTGSEVTPTATIWDHKMKKKYSLYDDTMYPNTAILDPGLTMELPTAITISSGLDAVSHALESIWNINANQASIALATQSLRQSLKALPLLKENGDNVLARTAMMNASLLAGFAIGQTRTALSHSISYPLTIEFGIPHGIASAITLPEILEFNAQADDGRLSQLAEDLGYSQTTDLAATLRRVLERLSLRHYLPMETNDLSKMANIKEAMITKGRIDNNLRAVGLEDVEWILAGTIGRMTAPERRRVGERHAEENL